MKKHEDMKAEKNKVIKKTKFFASYRKEIGWLEDMAKQGWFFKNITFGMRYTFEAGEPKHMLYEIDRFNLPQKPTREEILQKDTFMEIASDMGWQEVTHDETQTYYFCKEYIEGDINELYNDEKSRIERAKKFSAFLMEESQSYHFWISFMMVFTIILLLFCSWRDKPELAVGHMYFATIYSLVCGGAARLSAFLAKKAERELMLSRAEWENFCENDTHKTVKKMIWKVKKLKRFLQEQAKEGWVLTGATTRKYYFEKQENVSYVYTMDSQWLTNKRMKEKEQSTFVDYKDWLGKNNNWQVQSLKDAEAKGWEYVCALENKAVIYKGISGKTEPLNDEKYDNKIRFVSVVGIYGVITIVAFLLGMFCGFIWGALGL